MPAGYHAVRRVLGRTAIAIDRRPYQFLVAWVAPMWVILELARGKLLHYPLPLYVGISILCADAMVQGWHRLTDVFAAKWFGGAKWLMLRIWMGMGGGGAGGRAAVSGAGCGVDGAVPILAGLLCGGGGGGGDCVESSELAVCDGDWVGGGACCS